MIFWKEDSPTVLTRPPYLLFDIGGTKIRMAVSLDGKNLENPVVVGTPRDFNQGMQVFAETAKKIIGQNTINFVTGGMAGSMDGSKAQIFNSPHLPDWSGKNIKKAIASLRIL